tara:strand:- start:4271 stop:6322 length:2052 start_codon:yes stop_codon:yes gene_type:complete
MAVYRSDQAQLTFATEGAHGGYPEPATTVDASGGTAVIDLPAVGSTAAGLPAGSRSIYVDAISGVTAGEYIQIGSAANEHTEVRRVEHVDLDAGSSTDGSLILDSPTAFFHPDNDNVAVVQGVTEAATDKFMTWVPGVYETIEVPDPEMAIEGRYLLGTNQKRNFYVAYKGQQTFSGSLGGFVLLNGWPLRYPIGKVSSTPVGGTMTERTTLAADAKKGDYQITVTSATSIVAGDMIAIDGHQFAHASATAAANVSFSNQNIAELREVVLVTGAVLRLNYPLQFNHRALGNTDFLVGLIDGQDADDATTIVVDNLGQGASTLGDNIAIGDFLQVDDEVIRVSGISGEQMTVVRAEGSTTAEIFEDNDSIYKISSIEEITGTPDYYQHNIHETVDLDTISWNVHMRDSGETAANDFNRRYFGGHVGSMTMSADEGGLLTASWDGINFQDMVHNQRLSTAYDANGTVSVANDANLPGYALMQRIDSDDVGVPAKDGANGLTSAAGGFPSSDPYYFSQGSLQMFGVDFARVRSLSISIANNEEPRYYIGGQGKGSRRHRGPTEIRENNREYSMSASIVLPDSTAADSSTARSLFSELLLEGDYGTLHAAASMSGFKIVLEFTKGTNDKITITIPDDETAAAGGGEQGAFIRSAPHTVSGDNPLQVEADILFRNMKIEIQDSEPFYP